MILKQYIKSTNPIKYLTSKLAIASPMTPNDGIFQNPNTKIKFKTIFKNTENTVKKKKKNTISKA